MKKIFTLIICMAALVVFNAQAGHVTVGNKADFEAEFFKERANDVIDTIFVRATPSIIALTNAKYLPNSGTIHVIGLDDEENGRAKIGLQWNLPRNTDADRLSIFLENLVIECNGGNTAASKYLFNSKDTFYHYIDTLVFSNCEVKNYNRALFRVQPEARRSNGLKDAGDINYFAIEGCTFHTGYALNNPMSLFRLGMRVSEMVFRNNLFYNLGYVHSIVQFDTMTEEAGRVDINFTFENNTFIGHCQQGSLMNFDQYVGQMSEFHINNNIFLVPDWVDDYNNPGLLTIIEQKPDTLEKLPVRYLASIRYGMVECKNNVLAGFCDPRASLDTDLEGDFLAADINNLNMSAVDFGWDKFTDPEQGLFYIWKQEPIYTAGVDGAPIGKIDMYTEETQQTATVNISINGSITADIKLNNILGKKAYGRFPIGKKITVTAINKGGLNEFLGWSNGSKEPSQTIILEDDLDLVAYFKEADWIAAWNFEHLEKNNIKLDAPLEANFYKGGTPYTLCYATWDGTQYVDSTKEALMTRINNFPDEVRNCVFVHTDSASFADKTPSDYIYFEVPAVDEDSYLTFNVATNNMCYKTILVDYSTDKKEWTNITKFEMPSSGQWHAVMAIIPTELTGQNIYVRIKGDNTGDYFVSEGFDMTMMRSEFLFISEIYYFKTKDNPWNDNSHQFKYDMTIYYQLVLGEQILNLEEYQVAAFVGDDCRSVGKTMSEVMPGGITINYGYMKIGSDLASGDSITFRFLKSETNEEGTSKESKLIFHADTVVGDPSNPLSISADVEPIVVTALSFTREYGEPNPSFSYTVDGANIYGKPSIICEATSSSPVGIYPIIIQKGSIRNTKDSYVNGTLTITKAPLTISVGQYSRKQAEENPSFEIHYRGFKNGENNTVLTSKPEVNTQATIESEPGNYPIILSGATAANYNINYEDGTILVERTKFTISYFINNALTKKDSIMYGNPIPPVSIPYREGYTFTGWNDIPDTMPAKNLEIHGAFSINIYTVTWILENSKYACDSVTYGTAMKDYYITILPPHPKEGYTFSGWQFPSDTLMPPYDIAIRGSYSVNYYPITWMVDGEVYKKDSLAFGSALVAEDIPVKLGCTFSGWSETPATMPAREVVISGTFTYDEQCAAPEILYEKGELTFSCATEGAEIHSNIIAPDAASRMGAKVTLDMCYYVDVCATAEGYAPSDTVSIVLLWREVEAGPVEDGIQVGTIPVVVYSRQHIVHVLCEEEGTSIEVYTPDGRQVARGQIVGGVAEIDTHLNVNSLVVVKVGTKTVKLVLK